MFLDSENSYKNRKNKSILTGTKGPATIVTTFKRTSSPRGIYLYDIRNDTARYLASNRNYPRLANETLGWLKQKELETLQYNLGDLKRQFKAFVELCKRHSETELIFKMKQFLFFCSLIVIKIGLLKLQT